MLKKVWWWVAAAILSGGLCGVASAQTKLLRFPDVQGDKVVFTYAGDVWTAPATGGTATRLTAHPGLEVFAKFSPDGKWIAFTGQYDGDEQVYVIPSTGGVPKQLTFYPAKGPFAPRWGYDNQVYGWTNDGSRIVFRSQRDSWTLPVSKLYTVSPNGGPAEALPMPEAGSGDFSPDGKQMVYSPRTRDFRNEKRYGGGQANTLFTFDLATNTAKKISTDARAWRDPMWIGNTIFFNSDRDGHFNLYAYDNGKVAPVTANKVYDVRWPSSDDENRIVYELNGELQVFDIKAKKSTPLSITVPEDGLYKRPSRIPVSNFVEDFELSPKGERALFCARGDIFTVPVEKGPTRNLTNSSNAHEKWPRWSPDGARIAFISDKSGDDELWVIAQDGSAPPEQITNGNHSFFYAPDWSPDGKRVVFSNNDGKVYVVTLADKKQTQIFDGKRGAVRDYVWSPKGNFLAFSSAGLNGNSVIHLWSAADNKVTAVTDPLFNANNPAWDPNGSYLYYLSNREFAPQISQAEFNYATNRGTLVYALALRKDVKHPFPPESDEAAVTPEGEAPKPAAPPAPKPETIDFDGLAGRVARVPLPPENYFGLSAKTGHLLYVVGPAFYYGRGSDRQPSLRIYALRERRETTLVDGAGNYALSPDGGKVLVGAQGGFSLYDANPQTGERSRKPVSTAGMVAEIVPQEEWKQIFNEVWRRYRDFFYVTNMHGYDWEKVRQQYAPLLPHVAHRSDLNYVISEMLAELTVQHAYIDGGDFANPPRARVALPGARFELDVYTNRYRITKIFGGQNEEDIYRSPLTEVGVDARVGDFVLAVNGEVVKGETDIYAALRNKADNPVTLTLNEKPVLEGARQVSYRPVTDEGNLIYLDWVNNNRRKVLEMSGGRVGYLHIPDMGNNGIREFIKWYYGQLDKEGLVVDVRANGGGNVSRMLIERLRRKLLGVNYARVSQFPNTYPDGVFLGPMVSLLNENSASDGDIFPYMFREAGLGPLIGKRSWGGVVGINNTGPLLDGGNVSVPTSALANPKGEWVIEGYGVDPDIEVENDPAAVVQGKDPQLERGVQEVMKRLAKPVALPPRPAGPVKTP
jgi:tricorn protease